MALARPRTIRLIAEVDEELWIERVCAIRLAVELGNPALDAREQPIIPGGDSKFGT